MTGRRAWRRPLAASLLLLLSGAGCEAPPRRTATRPIPLWTDSEPSPPAPGPPAAAAPARPPAPPGPAAGPPPDAAPPPATAEARPLRPPAEVTPPGPSRPPAAATAAAAPPPPAPVEARPAVASPPEPARATPARAEAVPAPAATPPPPPTEFGPIEALRAVHFDFARSAVRPADLAVLAANARWIRDHPDHLIRLEVHADERGSDAENRAIGERRARAVLDYLAGQGVDRSRITVLNHGAGRPVCTDRTEACWARKRRIDFLARPR